jgi:cob(I)alamin adenosyltransferase
MLYTGKGDDGSTYFYGSSERFGKDHPLAEALGSLDELNSLLGLCRSLGEVRELRIKGRETFDNLLEEVQQNLFILQAELAGADKIIAEDKVEKMSDKINETEKLMPEIRTFFVAGTTKTSAMLDFARAVSRRTERRVIALPDQLKPGKHTLAYLNRLSSLLYALARLAAYKSGIKESAPSYK